MMAISRTTFQDGPAGDGAPAPADSFVWVSLHDPSAEEPASVRREFDLPGPVVEQLGAVAWRPSLEVVGQLLVAVIKTVGWEAAEEESRSGGVRLVLGDRLVVGVDRGTAILERVREDLHSNPELAGIGPGAVLPCVVDHAIDGYGPTLGALNEAVLEVEEAVFTPAALRPTERIYKLSRQVLEFRRATVPLAEMLDRLVTESRSPTADRLRRRFREERAHLLQLSEGADGLGSLLSNVLQANLTEVSVRQNDDMRRISAWVAIWAVPTLLAGIYGMNFRHMPELGWRFSYLAVLVLMVLIYVGLYRGFRRSGWL